MTPLSTLVESCPKEKRDHLAAFVADQLATGLNSLDAGEVDSLNAVLANTLSDLEHSTKRRISEKLAGSSSTSRDLARLLASEEASIAAPMLEKSPALSEEDLMQLAREKGQEHLKAISQRGVLSRELTTLLLSLGDAEVRRFILCNLGADISPEDFDRLVAELPGKMGNKISHLRKSNEQLIQDLLREESDLTVGPELAERDIRIPIADWLAILKTGGVHLDQVLTQLCLDKNLMAVASLMAEVSGVPEQTVSHLMVRFDATGLAVICKTLGVGDLAYSTLCRVRGSHLRLPASIITLWASNYSLLDARDATRLLNLMVMQLENAQKAAAPPKELARITS
ncbi:DUF2336 domain-containing protein [uncultured Roseibium sp.]|uniref:DUF2336 domain-containing protein n=1 Tax=uncultured Roseibium sp. TaxID=1936171 RepID=UPI00261D6CCA|nr:DUF2336 domain-containing protein [uncultured Roseibium sp.]